LSTTSIAVNAKAHDSDKGNQKMARRALLIVGVEQCHGIIVAFEDRGALLRTAHAAQIPAKLLARGCRADIDPA